MRLLNWVNGKKATAKKRQTASCKFQKMPNGNLSGPVSARLGPSYLQFSSAFLSLFLSHSCLSLLSIQRKGRGMGIHDSSSLQWSSDEVQLASRHDRSLDFANSLYFFAPLLIRFCFTFSIISYFEIWNAFLWKRDYWCGHLSTCGA